MNNQFLENATGFNRVVDSVKIVAGENSEIPLTQVLLISRVLFAVVMIGFIGYFFDRIKQSLFPVESKAKTDNRRSER
ncbi:hypothetical protein [Methyloglobulus sp.]|uniref:hypothetical protein n=1 Tax=Methyloglobulus sp. TaxID=2518622 RepID=UPI0032B76A76